MKLNRLVIVSLISIVLTAFMILLFFIIPGFPLLIFLFFPPLFCWGLQGQETESPPSTYPVQQVPRYCPQCGKQLLEPFETYCPRCGAQLPHNDE
ncbi:MAG: zinc-ribbon domain-containing protein [Promethearchaeota archaeon]